MRKWLDDRICIIRSISKIAIYIFIIYIFLQSLVNVNLYMYCVSATKICIIENIFRKYLHTCVKSAKRINQVRCKICYVTWKLCKMTNYFEILKTELFEWTFAIIRTLLFQT